MTFGLLGQHETDERKAKLLACSVKMREAWSAYDAYKQDLLRHDRDAVKKVLVGFQGELDKEWDKYTAEKQQHREGRERQLAENTVGASKA